MKSSLRSLLFIATLAVTSAVSAKADNLTGNLLANGSFESSAISWLTVGGYFNVGVNGALSGTNAQDGNKFGYLGGGPLSGIVDSSVSQTVADSAGNTYLLTAYLAGAATDPNNFSALVNGHTLANVTQIPDVLSGYTLYSGTFVGNGLDTVSFIGKHGTGLSILDNVSVNACVTINASGCSTSAAMPSSVTPEPSSFALLGTGVLGAVGVLRRRIFNA